MPETGARVRQERVSTATTRTRIDRRNPAGECARSRSIHRSAPVPEDLDFRAWMALSVDTAERRKEGVEVIESGAAIRTARRDGGHPNKTRFIGREDAGSRPAAAAGCHCSSLKHEVG